MSLGPLRFAHKLCQFWPHCEHGIFQDFPSLEVLQGHLALVVRGAFFLLEALSSLTSDSESEVAKGDSPVWFSREMCNRLLLLGVFSKVELAMFFFSLSLLARVLLLAATVGLLEFELFCPFLFFLISLGAGDGIPAAAEEAVPLVSVFPFMLCRRSREVRLVLSRNHHCRLRLPENK